MKLTNDNVQNVYLTSEVADLLGYEPNYLLRVAKGLMSRGVITPMDGRPAGNRNYLFNQKAVVQLQMKLNPKTYYLTTDGEKSYLHCLRVSALGILPPRAGWIALEDPFLVQACAEAVEDGTLDEFLEKYELEDGEHYFIYESDESLVNLEVLNEKMLSQQLYHLTTLRLVTWEEFLACERFVYETNVNGQRCLYEVEAELTPLNQEKTLFKNKKTGDYVIFASYQNSQPDEAVEFSVDDECVPYLGMEKEDLYQTLASDFGLTLAYKTFDHWDNQPYFATKNGEIVEIMSTSVVGNSLMIGPKDVYHLVNDIQTVL